MGFKNKLAGLTILGIAGAGLYVIDPGLFHGQPISHTPDAYPQTTISRLLETDHGGICTSSGTVALKGLDIHFEGRSTASAVATDHYLASQPGSPQLTIEASASLYPGHKPIEPIPSSHNVYAIGQLTTDCIFLANQLEQS